MRNLFLFLLIIVSVHVHPTVNAQQMDCCTSRLAKKGFENHRLKKLGKEYRRMKKNKDKCCEKFGSDLQKLMQALSEKLDVTGNDTCSVIKIMGVPDADNVPGQYGAFTKDGEKIMVYWWRGWHDFLYVVSEAGRIKYIKWFYALE
jgi:hypothetical protein